MFFQKYKVLAFFTIFILFVEFSKFLSNNILFSEELFINILSERYSNEEIQELFTKNREWGWLSYVLLPIPYLIKFSLVAMSLYIGLYFSNIKVYFKDLFSVVIIGEFVFFFPAFIKITWFVFFQPNFTLDDLESFHPLSAINLFDYRQIEPFLLYPLKLINVFELVYWFVLAYGLSKVINRNLAESMKIILLYYGSGLLLWVIFKTFIYIINS